MTTTTMRAAVLEVAALTAFRDKLTEIIDEQRVDLLADMLADGGLKWPAVLPDGETVAHATLPTPSKPSTKPTIAVDDAAFRAWVKATRPDDIVEAVRETTRRAIMDQIRVQGDVVIDKHGEVMPWATVQPAPPPAPRQAPKSFSLTWVGGPAGRERMLDAWRSGALAHIAPAALTSGGDS